MRFGLAALHGFVAPHDLAELYDLSAPGLLSFCIARRPRVAHSLAWHLGLAAPHDFAVPHDPAVLYDLTASDSLGPASPGDLASNPGLV